MNNIKLGDFLRLNWAFGPEEFYVNAVYTNGIRVCKQNWLSNDGFFIPFSELEKYNPIFIKKGKINIFSLIPFLGCFFVRYK